MLPKGEMRSKGNKHLPSEASMNCKINLVDFGVFTRVVYALLPEFTVITGCMRQNRGMHMGSGFRVSVVSGGKCICFLSKAFISCSFQL